MEVDNDPIPEPTQKTKINYTKKQAVVLIEVWMLPYRDQIDNKVVKKTLTIPKWLVDIAKENNVNYSHILKEALQKYLGVSDDKPPL